MGARERSVAAVPLSVLAVLPLALAAQLYWHHGLPAPSAAATELAPPPPQPVLEVAAAGDRTSFAKVLMLRLQAFDNQPGISIPFRALDYGRVIAWLGAILRLDERASYPLLAAARLYGEVSEPAKQRMMLEFVHEEFLKDPNRRWPWMAHAVFVARHRLHDMPLALRYADALATHVTDPRVPSWVTQMSIFVRVDMGETEAAKVLLGGLLESGRVTDPAERRFLMRRLEELERAGGK
ncbi:MAG: hypothetical protein R3F45_07800 [Gammaproteobacteria bacterium]